MPRFILTLWSLWIVTLPVHGAAAAPLELLSHALPHHLELELSQEDWRWLRWKRELVLGIALPDKPPFEMSNNTHDYEGITADYINIIGNSLWRYEKCGIGMVNYGDDLFAKACELQCSI